MHNLRKYYEKLTRMDEAQLPKVTLYVGLAYGARTSGGQNKRYKDQLLYGHVFRLKTLQNNANPVIIADNALF